MKRFFILAALVLTVMSPKAASASSVAFNCGTCGSHNTSFDISYWLLNPTLNTYQMTITATYQPAGAGSPDFTYLNDVAFKIPGVSYENGTPTFASGPAEDTWTLVTGGISAGGCNGSGGGFYCFKSTGFGATRGAAGSQDVWTFNFDMPGATALGPTLSMILKAQFTNADGSKVGSLISEEGVLAYNRPPTTIQTCEGAECVAAVPEPASLTLLGMGLTGIAVVLRRKTAKA